MNISDFDNYHEVVAALYPNHKQLFCYDTAKPQLLLDRMVDRLNDVVKSKSKQELYQELRHSVYAYGHNMQGGEGIIPLTIDCLYLCRLYREYSGNDVLFTPIIENLRPTQEGV